MNAGRLRHRVEIQSPSEARDSLGGVLLVWTTLATVSALVTEQAGQETWQDGTVRAVRSGTVEIRRYPGLTSRMRFLWGTRVLNIESVVADPLAVGALCQYREEG